jgi:hypothetical protein
MSKSKAKQSNPSETKVSIPQPVLRVLKVGACTNVSGKHKLTYHIGCDAEEAIHFRIYENSGSGYFSTEWVSLTAMQKAIETGPTPTTSYALYPLFKVKSVNTPAFLLAALLSEGLMQIHPDNPRCYATADSNTFMSEIKQLMDSNVNIDIAPKPKKLHKRIELMEAGPVNTNHKIKPGRPFDSQRLNKQ